MARARDRSTRRPVASRPSFTSEFRSGQPIVPIYEGWERVPDGSFNMVFGYLNRNHVEQPVVPVGAQNGFDPGPADRGQPTIFYPRENHFLFKVNVPQNWDRKKELIWTLTVNGKTEQAKATLLDIWEIDRKVEVSNNGGVQTSNDLINRDQPPVVKIDPIGRPKVGSAVTISASVTDDGIPGQRQAAAAAAARAVAARRAAVAGQRADAHATPSAAGHLGVVARLSRTGGRRLRTRGLRQGRGRQGVGEGHLRAAGHLHPARLRPRRHPPRAVRRHRHRRPVTPASLQVLKLLSGSRQL